MRKLILGLVAVMAIGAAGCGVSTTDQPVRVQGGKLDANSSPEDAIPAPAPQLGADAVTLVNQYFAAAVGGADQVRLFVTDNAKNVVQPQPGKIDIIRLEGDLTSRLDADVYVVTAKFRKVAELLDTGMVKLTPNQREETRPFPVKTEKGQRRIDDPLPQLVLTDTALLEYYERRSVYFWDQTRTTLVPDLRYVPLTLPRVDRHSRVVDAVLTGPSPFLEGAVLASQPAGTKRKDKIIEANGALVLNLSAQATDDPSQLRNLMIQLHWSLEQRRITLLIEGESKDLGEDPSSYNHYNYGHTAIGANPSRMAIKAGVLEVGPEDNGPGASPVPLLASPLNKGLIAAAVTLNHDLAVLVKPAPGNQGSVYVVRENAATPPRPVLTKPAVSRPEWVPRSNGGDPAVALIAAEGRLWALTEAGATPLSLENAVTKVTAVSVSPDGRRVALVANGAAYTAVLTVIKPTAGRPGVVIGPPQQLPPRTGPAAKAITWLNEHLLLVAGTQGTQGQLWQATVDGATLNPEVVAGAAFTPEDLITSPALPPARQSVGISVYLKADGKYREYFLEREREGLKGRVEDPIADTPVFPH